MEASEMGFHFDSFEECMAHLKRIDPNLVDEGVRFRVERYNDGTCLLVIEASALAQSESSSHD